MAILAICRKLTERVALSVSIFILAITPTILLWPYYRHADPWRRLALLLMFLMASVAWTIMVAAIGRRLKWPPLDCRNFAGMPFFSACVVLSFLTGDSSFLAISGVSVSAGLLCRKLVHPEIPWNGMTDLQASGRLTSLNL